MEQTACESCRLASSGEVVHLGDGWTINHLSGEQGFLGWLVLQPFAHRMELSELYTKECLALGGHIQRVDGWLHAYFSQYFSDDPLCRIYVVYFFESAFDVQNRYHLHWHLIPRTASHGALLRGKDGAVNAWQIYRLGAAGDMHDTIPAQYHKTVANVAHLMRWIHERVQCIG